MDSGGLVKMIYGIWRWVEADQQINQLGDYKNYQATPEMDRTYSESERRVNNPFSARSNTGFDAEMATSENYAYQKGVAANPSISGALRASANPNMMEARTDRGLQGDQLSASYLGMNANLAKQYQRLSDMNVSSFNARLLEEERALGQAKSEGGQDAAEGFAGVLNSVFGGMGGIM